MSSFWHALKDTGLVMAAMAIMTALIIVCWISGIGVLIYDLLFTARKR